MTFHYLFGPWAIIISSLVVDTMKFFVILMLFESGFCMLVIAMNQPYSVHVGLSGDAEKEQAFIQSSHGMLYKICIAITCKEKMGRRPQHLCPRLIDS